MTFKEFGNYSGTFLTPPVAALEKEGDVARTPRAPARGLRPPAPPAGELPVFSRTYE